MMDSEKLLDEGLMGAQARFDQATALSSGLFDLAQRDGLASQFLTDGAAEKMILVKDSDDSQVSWIAANHNLLLHIAG